MGAMGVWALINISSCITNGCQHIVPHITEKSRYSNRAVNDSNKAVVAFFFFFFLFVFVLVFTLQLYHWTPIS